MGWSFDRKAPSPAEGARAQNAGDSPDFIIPWEAVDDEYEKQLDRGVGERIELVSSVAEIPNGLPPMWEFIVDPDPDARAAAAISMWANVLQNMPLTARFLENRLLDVRLVRVGESEAGLAYSVLANETNDIVVFVGYDPRFVSNDPALWDSVPNDLREFISEVHSSVELASLPLAAFPLFKADMETLDSEEWEIVESREYQESGINLALDQLMMVHTSGGGGHVCVSPLFAGSGKGVFWRSNGLPIVDDFWTLYDVSVLSICA